MNKKIKRILKLTTLAGIAMYTFNKYIDYTSLKSNLTLDDDENYYKWRNGTIFYTKKGSGAPLLLIHDLNPISSSYEWSSVIDELAKTHTVYAPDLLGCGKSDKPSSTYVNYLYVELLQDFIKEVIGDATEMIVTGESFSFAVMAARMNPDLIKKITAINPTDAIRNVQSPTILTKTVKSVLELPIIGTFIYNLIGNKETIRQEFENKYYCDPSKVDTRIRDIYYEAAHLQGSNGKYLYASILGRYTNINIIHALKKVEQPIHLITTSAASEKIADYQTYREQTIVSDHISNAGYLPQLEKPEELLKLI